MEISDDYIRGLVEGEGCFTFCSVPRFKNRVWGKIKLPAFVLQMHERDRHLLESVREKLCPKNNIYAIRTIGIRTHIPNKFYKRGFCVRIIVRDLGQLKNIIIPFFYNKLVGHKGKQFVEWLEKIGTDPMVPESHKLIFRLYKTGYWDRNPNPIFSHFIPDKVHDFYIRRRIV